MIPKAFNEFRGASEREGKKLSDGRKKRGVSKYKLYRNGKVNVATFSPFSILNHINNITVTQRQSVRRPTIEIDSGGLNLMYYSYFTNSCHSRKKIVMIKCPYN